MAMEPLAYRMRPRTLDEVIGQEHLVGKDKIIYRMVQAKKAVVYDFIWSAWNRKNIDCKCDCWKHRICFSYTERGDEQ